MKAVRLRGESRGITDPFRDARIPNVLKRRNKPWQVIPVVEDLFPRSFQRGMVAGATATNQLPRFLMARPSNRTGLLQRFMARR